MKKIVCVLMVLAMLLGTVSAFAISARGINPGMTLYVSTPNGGTLNVREKPGPKATVTFKLPNHSAVVAYDKLKDGYLEVEFKYNGKFATGYVSIDFLDAAKPKKVNMDGATKVGDDPASKPKETIASLNFRTYQVVNDRILIITANPSRPGGLISLRWVPSMESPIIAKIAKGEELTVLVEGRDWYQVMSADGHVGFMYKKYCSIVYEGDGSDLIEEDDVSSADVSGQVG